MYCALTKQNLILASSLILVQNKSISFHLSGEIETPREEGKWFLFEKVLSRSKWTALKRKTLKLYVLNLPLLRKSGTFFLLTVPQTFGKYDNIILAGDLNIDELRPCSDSSKNYLSDMKDMVSLTKLIKEPTCFKSQNSTLLDLILTNRPTTFLKSQNFKTGLSDCHKLVCGTLWASFKKLPPKIVKYRDQKGFIKKKVSSWFDSKLIQGYLYRNCDEPYEKLSEIFVDILNHHTPLKEKPIRGNQAPLMTKELSKALMEKSKTRNKYLKW